MQQTAFKAPDFEPEYRADISRLADAVRTAHGPGAFDFAVETMHQHLRSAAWKNCALWLQIVNRLNTGAALS